MKDKNGIEIKTGDIVEITNAAFKNDNGLYFVNHSPGDYGWCGRDHCLHKISKRGKLSKSKATGFWPIFVTINDRVKGGEARRWNSEHARIEIVKIENMDGVIAHFEETLETIRAGRQYDVWNFGEDSACVKQRDSLIAHYEAVIARIKK